MASETSTGRYKSLLRRETTMTKTITVNDITNYARLVGDVHPIHVDPEYAKETQYGRPIAHGSLLVGLMSAVGTRFLMEIRSDYPEPNVDYGYDRIRFTNAVFAGDTVTTTIKVVEVREERRQVVHEIRCVNQVGELVAIATGIGQFLEGAPQVKSA